MSRRVARDTSLWLAGGLLAALVLGALLAPWLPLPSPAETRLGARLLPPGSAGHWLGTDHLGRDVLARLAFGLRASLAVSALGTAAAALLGTALGLVAGYRGGRIDDALMRLAETILAFPYVLLALALVAALGPGLRNAALAVAIVNVPFFARTVRGTTVALRSEEFVEAARLSGHSDLRILLREVLPNATPVLLVAIATTSGWMILETAGLSFLGLGAQPPRADLGSMIGDGRRFLATAPHLALVPGAALFAVSLAVHLVADALRDRFDPRAAGRRAVAGADAPPGDGHGGEATAAPLEDPVLRVECLRVALPDAGSVVHGIDFAVGRGETVALVGESGCGKTLTALALLGLSPARGARIQADRIALGDRDLATATPDTLRRVRGRHVAYVPQDPRASLDPLLAVGEQLVDALRAHRRLSRRGARDAGLQLLERVQLPDPARVAGARPHQLSGGMCQRVLIAMAVAHDPELLVADEPTTALDVVAQREILRLLEAVRGDERGLLLVTHDFGVVAETCDRVYVMRDGRIVEAGEVETLLRDPRHPYTRELLDCVPRIDDPERLLRAAGTRARA